MPTQYKSTIPEFKLRFEKSDFVKAKISISKDAADYCKQFFFDDINIYESFFMVLLNNENNTIGFAKISQGGITGTIIDPMIVAKYAIESLAKGVILCHNHPSGNLNPSNSDKFCTEKIKEGLSFFDCKVLDHIIITTDNFYSFADSGII